MKVGEREDKEEEKNLPKSGQLLCSIFNNSSNVARRARQIYSLSESKTYTFCHSYSILGPVKETDEIPFTVWKHSKEYFPTPCR